MFIDKVESTIKKYGMLEKGDRVLVGLSGGPDSVTLLSALFSLKDKYGVDIYVAHLDHGFRGEESAADSRFCEELTEKMGLEIICEQIDVPRIAKEKGISPEEAARFERYDFFKRVCGEKGIKKIAVGHNKDDQAETVIMRLVRGSGMAGLSGMNPLKVMQGFKIIRPLIEISRREIEEFLKAGKLNCRRDSSNAKTIFTRNKVRRDLIPYLEKNFNPNVKEVLSNTAENLRMENDFLERFANRKFKSVSRIKNGEILIDIKRFKRQPEAIRKRILRAALKELKGDLRRLTYQHWKEMRELIDNRPVNSIVDLPGGVNIVKNKTSVSLTQALI